MLWGGYLIQVKLGKILVAEWNTGICTVCMNICMYAPRTPRHQKVGYILSSGYRYTFLFRDSRKVWLRNIYIHASSAVYSLKYLYIWHEGGFMHDQSAEVMLTRYSRDASGAIYPCIFFCLFVERCTVYE